MSHRAGFAIETEQEFGSAFLCLSDSVQVGLMGSSFRQGGKMDIESCT